MTQYILRENEEEFFESFERMFVSALLGPRRVGKTTLVEHYIKAHPKRKWVQLNMDERKQRQRIANDELMLMIEESSLQNVGGREKLFDQLLYRNQRPLHSQSNRINRTSL